MTFTTHYSSSTGNLYEVVAANGKRLLIECGVPWRKLEEALDHDFKGIEGCLLSHDHLDHAKAAIVVMRNGIDLYASAGTFEALGLGRGHRAKIVESGAIVKLPSFDVLAFDVVHNVAEPLGFVVRDGVWLCGQCKHSSLQTDVRGNTRYCEKCGSPNVYCVSAKYLLFATDTCVLTQVFPYAFSIVAIGCNYDREILERRVGAGDMNEAVAKRILTSHPASWWVKKYLAESVCHDKLRQVHLLHCSNGNLDREKAVAEIREVVPFVKVI
jgi:phosphoribosyl 1,2-cyclic phosphodiesterase